MNRIKHYNHIHGIQINVMMYNDIFSSHLSMVTNYIMYTYFATLMKPFFKKNLYAAKEKGWLKYEIKGDLYVYRYYYSCNLLALWPDTYTLNLA